MEEGRRRKREKGEREGEGERWNMNIYEIICFPLLFSLSGLWVIRWHSPTLLGGEFPSLCFLIRMTTPTTDTLIDVSRNNTLPTVWGISLFI